MRRMRSSRQRTWPAIVAAALLTGFLFACDDVDGTVDVADHGPDAAEASDVHDTDMGIDVVPDTQADSGDALDNDASGQPDSPDSDTCVCDWDTKKPTTWGPAALVVSIAVMPANQVADQCHDYTGDGEGDASSFDVIATLLTGDDSGGAIAPDPPRVLVMKGYGAQDPGTPFRIDVLTGMVQTPAGPDGTPPAEFRVAVDAYDTSSCLPRSTLPNPVYGDATLWAGPGPWRLKIRFQRTDLATELLLVDLYARGIFIGATVEEGFRVPQASVSGIVTKEDIFTVIDYSQTVCDSAPEGQEPEACAYLSTAKAMVMQRLDFHRADDGTISRATSDLAANAMVLCLQVLADTPARVTGYAP